MANKAVSSDDLITTIARGVGSAVGRIANTAQRLATASSEAVKGTTAPAKKTKKPKPRPAVKKKAVKKNVARKPKAKPKTKKKRTLPAKA
jgi:hypothetical protein